MDSLNLTRRSVLLGLATLALAPAVTWAKPLPQVVDVWKDPNCGCCTDWVAHLKENGFQVRLFDSGNEAARRRLGMPAQLGSCHTALVAGYVLEGHVPAREIRRLLSEKPAVLGLAVPGMPVGSPGMDGPAYRGRRDAYSVLLVERDGKTRVFESYQQSGS